MQSSDDCEGCEGCQRRIIDMSIWDLMILIILAIIILIPYIIARKRKHQNQFAILVLSVLIGWSFIGWVVAMVWACTRVTDSKI